jgi:hypothetical protein
MESKISLLVIHNENIQGRICIKICRENQQAHSNIIKIAFTNFVIKVIGQYVYPIPKHWSRSPDFLLYYNFTEHCAHTATALL